MDVLGERLNISIAFDDTTKQWIITGSVATDGSLRTGSVASVIWSDGAWLSSTWDARTWDARTWH